MCSDSCQRLSPFIFWSYQIILLRLQKLNIELAYPELSERQRLEIVRASLTDLGQKFFSLISTWVRPTQNSYQLVKVVSGLNTFQNTSAKKPTLILLPHIGNWELFGVWLTQYRSATQPCFVHYASIIFPKWCERHASAAEIFLFLLPRSVWRQIWKRLNNAETAIRSFPDQAPKEGEGVYVPFSVTKF